MPVVIKLGSPIFDKAKRNQACSNAVSKTIIEFAAYVPKQQEKSSPSGRLYSRVGGVGFRRKHRASAKGQRPAIDTGKLLRSTKHKKLGQLSGEVTTIAKRGGFDYAAQLENKMDRPIQHGQGDDKAAQDMLNKNADAAIAKLI